MLRQVAPVLRRLAPASVRGFAVAGNHMSLIKELREASGAPIADVKAALQQANWDLGGWVLVCLGLCQDMGSASRWYHPLH